MTHLGWNKLERFQAEGGCEVWREKAPVDVRHLARLGSWMEGGARSRTQGGWVWTRGLWGDRCHRLSCRPPGRSKSSGYNEGVVGLIFLCAFAPALKEVLCQVDGYPRLAWGVPGGLSQSWGGGRGAASPALHLSPEPQEPSHATLPRSGHSCLPVCLSP